MNSFLGALLVLLTSNVQNVIGVNVLYVAAVASPSHHIWNRALAFGLVNKGHNVTYLGPDEDNVPKPENYTQILLEGVYGELHDSFDYNEMNEYGPVKLMTEFKSWITFQCHMSLKSKGLQRLLNYPNEFKFDLIIYDVSAGSCLYPLMKVYNYPLTVAVTPFLLPNYVSYNFGNNLFPSYIPWYGLPYSNDMSIIERVWNTLFTYFDVVSKNKFVYPEERKEAEKIFGNNLPTTEDLERHISLLLANTDPLLDHPQPVPPNIIPVGGLHARKSKKLPQDLQSVLDNAKNGVILFSLGTNIRSDKLDKTVQKAILKAFSQIPETVIWKFESEIENLPKNVIVRKWLPQNDIIGHPNVKLFIGHGGALSTQEAIFHGVPILAVPFAFDQRINARIIVSKRIGISIDFKRITSEYLLKHLKEILENPIYYENMKQLSGTFNDRLETPLERGIFWIEYVLRHGGANFLSTKARDLPFYAATGLDVFVFLLSLGAIVFLLMWKTSTLLVGALFCGKKKIKTH